MWVLLFLFILIVGLAIFAAVHEQNEFKKASENAMEKEIYLRDERALFEYYQQKEQFINKVLETQPKIIFANNDGITTFLTDKALCCFDNNMRYYESFPLQFKTIKFRLYPHTKTEYTTKEKNVVGRAIVGGVLTGGVGAVVGAASGLSNGGKKNVKTTVNTGTYGFLIAPQPGGKIITPRYILVDKKYTEKPAFVENVLCELNEISAEKISWLSNDSYKVYKIPGHIKNSQFAEKIISYLKQVSQV